MPINLATSNLELKNSFNYHEILKTVTLNGGKSNSVE